MFPPRVAEEGNSNVPAQFSSIRVFTVGDALYPCSDSRVHRSLITPLFFSPARARTVLRELINPLECYSISKFNQPFGQKVMANTTYAPSLNMDDSNARSGNIISSFNKAVYTSDVDAHIIQWLSPREPQNRHHGVSADRFDGVGSWLLATNEFRGWRDSEGGVGKAVVFCSGYPGVGKTYLSSLVIDGLCDRAGTKILRLWASIAISLRKENRRSRT
ncbi:hypothetical protein L873DRAFT_660958 [Choiromyces venosus 120613-1]|uniref:Nephrocystin 3-like N-terminal domain-containing protein n=1 Tax=Choiromyces venosus 120613-1 TaxID=1336337 RepID=A0A3N4IYM2_9PEZI|nr:hypothetical protein L873DRAFT_660958 [Choiromyces venosus 120613-1]